MSRVLHFTLGPVQGFIADARRTRDFWAGSFILSLLSGHAMKAIKKAYGEIIFPEVDGDELFEALLGNGGAPYVGSLPNRFKADVTKVAGDPGEICKQAVNDAWGALSQRVWKDVVEKQAHLSANGGNAAWAIWQRQVGHFWDMAWVAGDDPGDGSDGSWLDLRKNWRSHNIGKTAAEGGDHCRMMGDYQEISGFHRIGEKDKQTEFWEKMREVHGGSLDLQADERLCAIALIKRFFPVVVQKCAEEKEGVLPFVPGGTTLNIRHWPSTSYIAALPWLKAAERLDPESQNALWQASKTAFKKGFMGEVETPKLFNFPEKGLFCLDGHLLHRDGIKAYARECIKSGDLTADEAKAAVTQVTNALKTTAGSIGGVVARHASEFYAILLADSNSGPNLSVARHASEFYAILRMDGDDIGKRLRGDQKLIKTALAGFTERVKKSFAPGNPYLGILVYAGGDDVLALLPVDYAIRASLKLRAEYDAAFDEAREETESEATGFTLSGSIVYSHFKNPLAAVLRQSEHYLSTIAKDDNGRNSLAVAVLKPGGVAADWVTVFDGEDGRIATLDELARAQLGVVGSTGLSGGFFHGFRQKYEGLFTAPKNDEGGLVDHEAFKPTDILLPLLTRDIQRQFGGRKISRDEAVKIACKVRDLLQPQMRDAVGAAKPQIGVAFGGGLVARFLSTEGRYDLSDETEKCQ